MIVTLEELTHFEKRNFKIKAFKPWSRTEGRLQITFAYKKRGRLFDLTVILYEGYDHYLYLRIETQTDDAELKKQVDALAFYLEKKCKDDPLFRLRFLTGKLIFQKETCFMYFFQRERLTTAKIVMISATLFTLLMTITVPLF